MNQRIPVAAAHVPHVPFSRSTQVLRQWTIAAGSTASTAVAIALFVAISLFRSPAALAQESRCIGDALDSDAAAEGRWQPCVKPGEQRNADSRDASGNPRVITPPGAVMKRVAPPDPKREERLLREKLHRALRKNDRGRMTASPECQAVVKQIADEQPRMRSLRAETRAQARERVDALTNQFRTLECDEPPERSRPLRPAPQSPPQNQ